MFNKKPIAELEAKIDGLKMFIDREMKYFFETEKTEMLIRIEEANKKLIDFMDITRKEALDSYRKGLQDGLNVQIKNAAPEAPYQPVMSIQEHTEAKEDKRAMDKIAEGFSNILNYTGKPQKEGEED